MIAPCHIWERTLASPIAFDPSDVEIHEGCITHMHPPNVDVTLEQEIT